MESQVNLKNFLSKTALAKRTKIDVNFAVQNTAKQTKNAFIPTQDDQSDIVQSEADCKDRLVDLESNELL